MTLSDYIKVLQALEPLNGGREVAITQSGYYSEGPFADLFIPPEIQDYKQVVLSSNPEQEQTSTKTLVILGHSHQSY